MMTEDLPGHLRHLLFAHFGAKGVRRGLRESLQSPPLSLPADELKATMQSIAWKAGEIMVSDSVRAIDPPSRGHLTWSAWILAAWHVLRPQFNSDDEAIDFIGEASLKGFDTPLSRLGIWLVLRSCRGGRLDRAARLLGGMIRQYGATFKSDMHCDDHALCFHVTGCFYYDFFSSHDLPKLTTALCRLDHLWFDRIDPQKHGLEFDLDAYQTMSEGADCCKFPIVQVRINP